VAVAVFWGGDGDIGEGWATSKDEGVEEVVMLGSSSSRSQEEIRGGGYRLRGRRSGWRGLAVALKVGGTVGGRDEVVWLQGGLDKG